MEYFEIVDAVEAEREANRLMHWLQDNHCRKGVFFYRVRSMRIGGLAIVRGTY